MPGLRISRVGRALRPGEKIRCCGSGRSALAPGHSCTTGALRGTIRLSTSLALALTGPFTRSCARRRQACLKQALTRKRAQFLVPSRTRCDRDLAPVRDTPVLAAKTAAGMPVRSLDLSQERWIDAQRSSFHGKTNVRLPRCVRPTNDCASPASG